MPLSPASALLAMDGAARRDSAEMAPGALSPDDTDTRSQASGQVSQTASDYITSQMKLEAEARDVLPYSFDTCTKDMGPLRQNLFACLTCNPPPQKSSSTTFTPAGICYSCSISCHGEHDLVELFTRRNFVCDCGTTRLPSTSPCTLRLNQETGIKGRTHSQEPAQTNTYNQNFRNRFCGCAEWYEPLEQKGTMFQCLGLATEEEGGCGEDWWHPECLMGLKRDWYMKQKDGEKEMKVAGKATCENEEAKEHEKELEHPVPPGFPGEEAFDTVICYKCVEKIPWLKRYANAPSFVGLLKGPVQPPGSRNATISTFNIASDESKSATTEVELSGKRSRDDGDEQQELSEPATKRSKVAEDAPKATPSDTSPPICKLAALPPAPTGPISLLAPDDFRERLCRCSNCYTKLRDFPQLLEEEETYEPPLSEDGDAPNSGGSIGTGSLLERGEAALSNMDRVRAIEGVMVYNHLKDKVKTFLKPFAESGQMVSADDIRAYFEKLRGDAEAIREARTAAAEDEGKGSDGRHEQSGY